MTVSPVDNITTRAPTPASETQIQVETADEFNQFLQLLTAQVENQDPLQPLDSTQFVEQLATFSSLEEQVQTNDLLASILSELRDQA
ncbi:MAG: flagellar hook capping FlgD N-terminal domain-containing protein [Pseudomonadota bacterium]